VTGVSEDAERPPTLVYAIGRVNQGIEREMRRRLRSWGLSVADFTVLSVLERRPGLSNAQLSRRSLITPQSMNEVLASLEARDLVRRVTDPEHGRILRAELTRAGTRALRVAGPAIEALQDEIFAGLPTRQRDTLLRGMIGAMDRLSAGFDAPPQRDPSD
jgi:DNA-binding MarR family transcriptional regulator